MTREIDDPPDDHPGGYALDDIFVKPVDPGSAGLDGDVLKPKDPEPKP